MNADRFRKHSNTRFIVELFMMFLLLLVVIVVIRLFAIRHDIGADLLFFKNFPFQHTADLQRRCLAIEERGFVEGHQKLVLQSWRRRHERTPDHGLID